MAAADHEKTTMVEIEEHNTAFKENIEYQEEKHPTGTEQHALKGDDSNGKINWTPRTVFAAISLSGLFTASQILLYFTGGVLGFIIADVGNAQAIAWIPTAYLVALASICPFVGYLQDLFGRREIGIFGATLLCVGCIVLGTAHTFRQAIVAMVLSGAGASISELTALAGISDIVPVKYRGLAIGGITSFMIPFLPFVLYGQLMATRSTWRWTAWLCLIYSAIVLVGIVFTYFPKNYARTKKSDVRAILKELDYIGGLLSTVGLVLVLVALNSGGYTHPWASAYVLCQLVIGIALISAFVIWEWKFVKTAMVPAALFEGQRVVALAYVVVFVAGMNFYAFLNLFPTTLSSVYTPSPVEIGIRSFGFALGVGLGVPLGDAALSFVKGQVKIVLLVSATLMTTFLGALAVSNPTNSALTTTLASFAGLGCGGILTPAGTVAMIVVPDQYLATTVALSLSIRAVGGSVGYAIYSNIFNNKLASRLPAYIATYAIEAGLPFDEAGQFVEGFLTVPMDVVTIPNVTPTMVEAATLGRQWAFADSFQYVWLSTIAFGALAIIVCLFIPSIRKWETNRIAAEM